MITTKIVFSNTSTTDIQSFEGFNSYMLGLVESPRNSFVEDLRFSIKQGWIKNLHNQQWNSENKTAAYEYYSDDLHQARYFQNFLSSKGYFPTAVDKCVDNGWSIKLETVAENVIVPYVDAQRIFDENIEVLV
jgi:hypothetical protein